MGVSELLVCIGSWFHRQQGRPGYASACVAAVDSMKMRRMVQTVSNLGKLGMGGPSERLFSCCERWSITVKNEMIDAPTRSAVTVL